MADNSKAIWKSILNAVVAFLGALVGAIFGS